MPAVVDTELCSGCGDCVDECPVEAIEVWEGTARVDPEECTDCSACVEPCEQEAITCD